MKASEKRLLAAFLGLLFLGVNWLLFQRFSDYTSGFDEDLTRLNTRRSQLQALSTQRPEWEDRKNWVTKSLPIYPSEDERDTYLINFIRKAVADSGVEIDRGPLPAPAKIVSHYEHTGVSVTVTGEIQPVVTFLHLLQEPTAFRAVTSLRLTRQKKDESAVRCEISIEQWWALNSLAAAASLPSAASELAPEAEGQTPPTPNPDPVTNTDNG